MGSYSTLYISGREVRSRKHELDHLVMTLFQKSERRIRRGTIEEVAPDLLDEDRENASEAIELLTYETMVKTFRDRLDLMGFTLGFVQKEYDRLRSYRLSETKVSQQEFGRDNPAYLETLQGRQRALSELTFHRWLDIFRTVWEDQSHQGIVGTPHVPSSLDELLVWYVSHGTYDDPYGFPGDDMRLFLRVVCEISSEEAHVVYDLSELVAEGGESDYAKTMADFAEQYLAGGYATTRKIIVLTEGCSDQRTIEASLGVLHPGIKDYFSFLDFETLAVQGGVSAVLNTLKAFISVGIANRIVALLDNDTAGHAAVQAAKLVRLPQHVRIVFLPHLGLAERYPTLGPSGKSYMDINGLAGSIELYFGLDVLTDASGDLMPIQWKGYDDRLRRYQGEIMHKPELQNRFLKKVEEAKKNNSPLAAHDWTGMEAVVQCLVTAFHDMPPLDYGLENTEE